MFMFTIYLLCKLLKFLCWLYLWRYLKLWAMWFDYFPDSFHYSFHLISLVSFQRCCCCCCLCISNICPNRKQLLFYHLYWMTCFGIRNFPMALFLLVRVMKICAILLFWSIQIELASIRNTCFHIYKSNLSYCSSVYLLCCKQFLWHGHVRSYKSFLILSS